MTDEIDRAISLEAKEISGAFTSIDDLNERRMVCKFFGHAPKKQLRKYKGVRTFYCPYCAEILSYGEARENQIIPDYAAFVFEYMLDAAFVHYKHPKADK